MSTIVRVGNRQLTSELICQHLSRSSLLPQLLREIILDRVLAQWEPSSTAELADGRAAFEQCYQQLAGLTHSRNMSQVQITKIAERTVKLQQFKQGIWGGKLGSYFLERKSQLDRVVFSVMQIEDGSIAQELFFRIQSGETPFAELARQYSQGIEAQTGGKVGPMAIANLHPDMARQLTLLAPGQVSPLFIVGNAYVFVQLEETLPAQFDDSLRQLLLDELFENWLQVQISNEIGLISVETDFIPPDFMTNSQRVIVEEQGTNGLKLLFPVTPNDNDTLATQAEPTGLERGDPSLLLSQLSPIGNPPTLAAGQVLEPTLPVDPSPEQFVLERGDTGLLLGQLEELSNLSATPEVAPDPAPTTTAPAEQFVLERGDTGLLLAQLEDLFNPPIAAQVAPDPAATTAAPAEQFVLERGDTGLLLAQLGDIAHPPAAELEPEAAPTMTAPAEQFVLERGDTGLLLAQLGDIAYAPAPEVEKPAQITSAFNTTSSFFQSQSAATTPIIYISDLDLEFDAQKWLAILAISIATLAIGLGSFYQLKSTGLSNTPIQQQQSK